MAFNIMDLFGPGALNRLLQPAQQQGVQNFLANPGAAQPGFFNPDRFGGGQEQTNRAPAVGIEALIERLAPPMQVSASGAAGVGANQAMQGGSAGIDPWAGMREADIIPEFRFANPPQSGIDPMVTGAAQAQGQQPAPVNKPNALANFFNDDRKAVLNDFFTGMAQGRNPGESFALGALNIRNRTSQRDGLNQTVQWLTSKGVSKEQAKVLAEEAQMGNKAPLNDALKYLTQGADPMKALELQKTQLEIERLRNPTAKNEDTALIRELKAAGLKEGTPEFQEAILANNRPKGMMIESDGQGGFKMVQGTDVSGGANMNVEQGKNTGFLLRAQDADKVITNLESEGTSVWNNTAGQLPGVGNYLRGDGAQKFDQAKRDFINAQLRQESGAVISPEEFKNAEIQYFPQPGDSAAVIEQKRANRQNAISGFRIRSGPGAQSVDKMTGQDAAASDPLGIR